MTLLEIISSTSKLPALDGWPTSPPEHCDGHWLGTVSFIDGYFEKRALCLAGNSMPVFIGFVGIDCCCSFWGRTHYSILGYSIFIVKGPLPVSEADKYLVNHSTSQSETSKQSAATTSKEEASGKVVSSRQLICCPRHFPSWHNRSFTVLMDTEKYPGPSSWSGNTSWFQRPEWYFFFILFF